MTYSKEDLERMKISLGITDEDYKPNGKRKFFYLEIPHYVKSGRYEITEEEYKTADIYYLINKAKDDLENKNYVRNYKKIIEDFLAGDFYIRVNGFTNSLRDEIKNLLWKERELKALGGEKVDVLEIALCKNN